MKALYRKLITAAGLPPVPDDPATQRCAMRATRAIPAAFDPHQQAAMDPGR